MGKTIQPVSLHIPEAWADFPEFAALVEKGHVFVLRKPDPGAIFLGDDCWYMEPRLFKYLDLALKGARSRKREQTTKEGTPKRKAPSHRKTRPAE